MVVAVVMEVVMEVVTEVVIPANNGLADLATCSVR
jgi:phage tail protein X